MDTLLVTIAIALAPVNVPNSARWEVIRESKIVAPSLVASIETRDVLAPVEPTEITFKEKGE